ncbi:hypothetical protein GWK47_030298 [Chionoecetes opilio]|uniref:Uncharacterized protein n=1 Tax=Chionoecetes opilio TaxID=41210 RepID=A0A8J4YXH4_CHIOP|nr:hypothetical protein GWK47_030298 [Chionoecetes opilio]
MESKAGEMQRYCLMNNYENDKLEQYSRRDNLRISGLEVDEDESEEVLEAKIIELAATSTESWWSSDSLLRPLSSTQPRNGGHDDPPQNPKHKTKDVEKRLT